MATTTTADGEATCPLCDDYMGVPSSVEAHISRMTDPVHQGEVGRAHRDQLQREAEETSVETTGEPETVSSKKQGVETTGEQERQSSSDNQGGNGEMPTDREYAAQRDLVSVDGSGGDRDVDELDQDESKSETEQEAGSFGVPAEAVVFGIAVLVVVWLLLQLRGPSGTVDDQDDRVDQTEHDLPSGLVSR